MIRPLDDGLVAPIRDSKGHPDRDTYPSRWVSVRGMCWNDSRKGWGLWVDYRFGSEKLYEILDPRSVRFSLLDKRVMDQEYGLKKHLELGTEKG